MRHLRKAILALVLVVALTSNAFVFLAIPFAIEGAQVLMAGAIAAAAAAGIIAQSQGSALLRSSSDQLPSDSELQSSAADSESTFTWLMKKITGSTNHESCDTARKDAGTCNAAPEVCCKEFLDRFKDQLKKASGSYGLYKDDQKRKMLCCYEWDHQHGGFEIFDKHGHHLGERGCDDLSQDPCQYTESRGKHAAPNSATHKPRSQLCSPH